MIIEWSTLALELMTDVLVSPIEWFWGTHKMDWCPHTFILKKFNEKFTAFTLLAAPQNAKIYICEDVVEKFWFNFFLWKENNRFTKITFVSLILLPKRISLFQKQDIQRQYFCFFKKSFFGRRKLKSNAVVIKKALFLILLITMD